MEEESARFGDLVQGNFVESYRHLAYKHLMGLGWAANYCRDASFVVKMDDDISVDLFRVLAELRRQEEEERQQGPSWLWGFVQSGLSPERDSRSKWFVSGRDFPGREYPDFLSGWAYGATMVAARDLLEQAGRHPSPLPPFFWIDDLWVTGYLAREAGVALRRANDLFTVYTEHLECCVKDQQQGRSDSTSQKSSYTRCFNNFLL